jgi:O-Antigen ligase
MAERSSMTDHLEQSAPWRGLFLFAPPLALGLVALVAGGASRLNPIGLMLCELFGVIAVAPALLRFPDRAYSRLTWAAFTLLALTFALPLLQLVPLPPAAWMAAPGREPLAHAVALIGLPSHWRPISLAPDQTAGAVLFLLAPAGMFLAALQCEARLRVWLVLAAVIVALISLPLGAVQVAAGQTEHFQFYAAATPGLPNGFFANRNHQAAFMIAAIGLSASLLGPSELPLGLERRPLAVLGLIMMFTVGAAVTLSRAGLLLLGPVLIVAALIMQSRLRGLNRWFRFAIPIAAVVGVAAVVLVLKGGAILDRFEQGSGAAGRISILPKVVAAGQTLQPLGGGIGTFDTVYRAVEPLDQVIPEYLNHVHDDYVELWLEGGWAAVALMASLWVWWGFATFAAWFGPARSDAALARSGSLVVAALLIHSVADYPLRTPALAVVFALACAMMLPTPALKRPG